MLIPHEAPLHRVRTEIPFVFLAVSAAMMLDDPLLQHQLGEEVRQQAFKRVLLGNEKSLDLLQGLLIYLAWYCHFYRADKHQELLLSQLCVSLAHDLDLDKSRSRRADRCGQSMPHLAAESKPSIVNARIRAYLGTYCVSCLYAFSTHTLPTRWLTAVVYIEFLRSYENVLH